MARKVTANQTTTTTTTISTDKGTNFLNFYSKEDGSQLFYRCIDSNESLVEVLKAHPDNASMLFETDFVRVTYTVRGQSNKPKVNLAEKLAEARQLLGN